MTRETRVAYGETLAKLVKENQNIVVLDADLSKSTKSFEAKKVAPERHFNAGIAESNMMGMAAGLAASGKTVFASTFAVFATGRPFEIIRNSICYPKLNVKICATHAGLSVGEDGASHQAIEDVEAAMKGMLDPIFEEKIIGHAEVRQIFKASSVGNIAGSYILDGEFQRGCKIRITREGEQIYEGELASLKRFKDDVKEVKAGFECGLVFDGFDKMQELDIVEAYIMVEVPR